MNRRLLIGAAALVLLAGMFGAALLPGGGPGALSAYDTGPFGLNDARRALADAGFLTRNVASSPLIARDVEANDTLLVIAGLDRPYTSGEADALDGFLHSGGSILVLDDDGYGEDYTKRHGIEFLRRPLLDASFDRNQSFVRVAAHLGGPDGDHQLMLNSPYALRDVAQDDASLSSFMVSSNESFLDLDRDGTIDVADKVGPFNVGLRRDVGEGTLFVIADSGFAINDMLGREDNARFLLALARSSVPEGGLVVFDESKRAVEAPEVPILVTERSTLAIARNIPQLGLLILASVLFLAVLALMRLPGRESWVHRHRPGQYVAPPQARTKLQLVTGILQAKQALDRGSGVSDPLVEQALADPDALRDEDLHRLLEHVRSEMDLEVAPDEGAGTPAPGASSSPS